MQAICHPGHIGVPRMREIYNIDQACEALSVGRRQFHNWREAAVAAGKLPPGITQFTLAQVQQLADDHRRDVKDIDAIADAGAALRTEVQSLREEVNNLQSRVAGLEALLSALIMPNRLDLHPVSDSPASLPAVHPSTKSASRATGKRLNLPSKKTKPS